MKWLEEGWLSRLLRKVKVSVSNGWMPGLNGMTFKNPTSSKAKGLVTKSNAILQKQGKGGVGRAKLQDALRLARDSSVRVRFHPGRSREEDVAVPVVIFFDVVPPTVHVNSMGELGSDSTGVQCLDNTVLTSPFVDITIGQYCLGFLGQGRPSVS